MTIPTSLGKGKKICALFWFWSESYATFQFKETHTFVVPFA
jgi:hypothetical protein